MSHLPKTLELPGPDEPFTVTVLQAEQPVCWALFAVGAGGNPLRHLPLLQSLARSGCSVIAPHHAPLTSLYPTRQVLEARVRRLALAADACAPSGVMLKGVGHSIGTAALLTLAGGRAATITGDIAFNAGTTFDRLALLTPTASFFRMPGALDAVNLGLRLWVGAQDPITPPTDATFLKTELGQRMPVDVVLDEEAGHFTYMNELPPSIVDPHPDRGAFLADLAEDVTRFVTGPV